MRSSVSPSLTRMRSVPFEVEVGIRIGNLAHQPLAPIRTNDRLHHNLVAGTGFRHVGARSFQASGAALADKIEIELHALNVGSVEGIGIDASKAIADSGSGQSRRGLPIVLRGKHVPQRDVGISLHAEHAIHAVSNVFAVFVGAVQCVEDRGHHGQWAEPRVIENFVMEFFRRCSRVECAWRRSPESSSNPAPERP